MGIDSHANGVGKQLRFSTKDEKAISETAAKIAREKLQSKGWSANSSGSIQPVSAKGYVGLRTTVDYVMFQNEGIKPFLMTWVEGRIVPMQGAGGSTEFRLGKEVGQPGWVTLPGGVKKWRDQKWRHPGLKPQHFLEDALKQAIKQHKPTLRKRLIDALMGRYKD